MLALSRDSQSKHTRSVLIPRSVAVNVEAEAEYISQRRNEVSVLVNKQRLRRPGRAGARAAAPGARAPRYSLQEFYFHDKRHVLINSHRTYDIEISRRSCCY